MATYGPKAHTHRPHVSFRVAVGMALLLVAALGVGVLIGRSTKSAEPVVQGLAQKEVVAAIDGSLAALNRGDFEAFGAYLTENAVFEDPAGFGTARGRQAIVEQNRSYQTLGARYYRESVVVQRGNLAAYAVSCPPCPGAWSGIDLVRFTDGWKIDHVWTGNTAGPAPAR